MYLKAFFQKTTLWFLAVLALLLGVFVYAKVDRTVYITQQLIVIPDRVTSDTWIDVENALLNDVLEESLYQDFNKENSAYLDAALIYSPATTTEVKVEIDTEITPETGNETINYEEVPLEDSIVEEVVEKEIAPVSETVVEPLEEVVPDEEVPAPEPVSEPAPAETSYNSTNLLYWGLLVDTNKRFPLAQEVITTNVTSTEEAVITDEEVIEEVRAEEVVEEDAEEFVDEIEGDEETVSENEVTSVDEEVQADEEPSLEEGAAGEDDEASEEIPEEIATTIYDACVGDLECKLYSTTFSGFSMPEFESGNFLTSAQLRLSLAAQTVAGSEIEPQRFVVEYKYATDSPWLTATTIDIEDETSNSINGGYYLVSLERPAHQSQLSYLEVRVSYQGNIDHLKRAYIESLWLEVSSAKFYEENDPEYLETAIDYERSLLTSEFLAVNETDLDPVINELPSFTMSYSPQQGFFRRIATSFFSENEYAVDRVRLIDSTGTVVDVPVNILYHDDKTWTVEFLKQPQKLVPGKYKLEVTVNENETMFVDSFEFYWGVLAVNTTKSMYFPREDITLNLAALTEKGDTICDASLELKIIDPNNVIFEIPVEQSGSCDKNNVTDIPDYLAYFKEANEIGKYTIQLHHLNRNGEVVHKIQDSFEVREYIPFDIERTAPTRIYPPAPYDVNLKVKAYRSFEGDIVERVPRGFVLENYGEAEILTMPDYTELVWRNVKMEEGETKEFSYNFDAPDISPYMYLLGPLNMDGFEELRQWQIASDALTAIASFTGTRTVAGTNLNSTPSPMQWSTSTMDSFYYDHSTSTDSHQVVIRQAGDYFLAVTLPLERTDTNVRGTRIGAEVRVNGTAVPESIGRSGYITNNGTSHQESSTHAYFLLSDITVDDTLEVYVEGLTTINGADIVNVTGKASMYLEYIESGENVFAATTTQTTNSTNLNQTTEYGFSFIETRQDSGFTHSDSVNPDQIIIANPGTYLVNVSIPLSTDTTNTNILGRVRLDGAQVLGGQFKQGYAQSPATESDGNSSIHFSGIVVATTTNQILTITATREAQTGTVTVTSGFVGSVFVRELPSTEVIALRGTAVVSGANWNPAAASAVQWTGRDAYDSGIFTHSTSTNSHQITIASNGDYFLSYNDALTGTVTRANSRVAILKNGTAISGAQTKSHYIRNQNGHAESSTALVILLEGLVNSDVITVTTIAEAAAGTLDDSTSGVLMMWKKAVLNERPTAPTMYNAPFDNIRFASTTPYFDFSALDPDGTSNIEYEFSIATSTGFVASSTYNSGVDSEFFNTASSTDTSPFVEGNKVRFQLTSGDALTDITTYYWRARARDLTGSAEFGDWSTTQSLTVDLAVSAPSWFQSYNGQFEGDTLVGTVSSGGDQVQVDAGVSSEIMIVYGEGTVTTPRYRLWDGATWGVEGNAVAVTNTINWVDTAAAVSRNEYALATLDASNDAYAQIYSASTTSWGNRTLLSPVVSSVAYRGIAVAYESLSGDAIAVSCTNSPNPVYRVWNGSSWSATSSITVSSGNNCNFIELASDPASDEMILVVRDTGTQYEALVWNGTAWVESRVIGSSALVAREGLSVVYEASGDQAVIAVSDNANNNIIYTTWNGVEFSANATQAIGNDIEFAKLTSDPNSDKVSLCYIDTDNDIGVLRWDGGVWATFVELDTGGNIDTGRPIECAFETLAGRSNYLMAVYSDTVNVRYRAATSTTWSTEVSIGTVEDSFWVQSERAGDGLIMSVSLDDSADDLDASYWNGTTWSAEETLETSPSSVIAAPYEMYDMSAKKFQFSEGQVVTPPIDFTAVPSQPTWGDISFSTTEPFGTDVILRVKYSSTTACDQYIPDGALSGNGTGFDVSASPIDLTSLSTSTYDQICLEATLTTLGSASALLDDWTLAWVRQPKLAQNNYRWYVNGSFLTPTDVWPAGVTDLALNAPLTSGIAINADEVIRLRMSLQGENVESPAFSEVFKIQYAEGLTCSQSLVWHDVGDTASTTALWRGYENSIVGSDWYSSAWPRRIKITVDSGMVTGGQSNFPVFVNLDDLPDAFFTSVQADGDDIRITSSDGVTELPYELVSIDTASKIGELHFKATVSSTTDSEFFVYYGNSGASGYSVSATYGRNNVWSNGFLAVYHLDQNPTSTAPQFIDSTGNNTGTATNLESSDRQTSLIGRAIDFDGTNEYIDTNFSRSLLNSTWSIWLRTDGVQDAYDGLLTSRGTLTNGININSGTNRLGYHWRDAVNTYSWNGAPIYPTNQWFMASLVIEPTQATMYQHSAAGATSSVNAVTHATATVDNLDIGQDSIGGRLFNGIVDEVTMSNSLRSATWLSTTYNNKSNATGFYAVSGEELISDGRLLPTTLLTGSDFAETYEEENPTRENQNTLPVGNDAEWDFVLQNNNAAVDTNYCFRMVYEDGSLFNTYTNYPRLITNAPPLAPELYAPFDNERLASTTPWFEFAATDEVGDDIAYQIQVDTDVNFASPDIDNNSIANFALFTNLLQPSQKSEFTSGQRIRFEGSSALTNGNTYWWRVRGEDLSGSGEFGDWSTPYSVTINTSNTITTWFQTTGSQFATDNLLDLIASTSTNDIGIDTGFTAGTTTSNTIDYDDRTTGNAWGDLSFTHNITSGTIRYYLEYLVSGETYALIPDADLPSNSSGFTTSPVALTDLNTTTYNEIRLRAVFSGNTTFPRLQDWTVTWAETIEIPTLTDPFDNAKVATTSPSFTFFSTDPETDAIQYEFQLSSAYDFAASSTFVSGVAAGFTNTASSSDTSPFTSADYIRYTVQSALTNGNTYWWRVRARDPGGDNVWSEYSTQKSFTIDTSISVSAWHQSTGEQFTTDALDNIETSAGAAQITSTVNELLMAYGEGTGQAPRYRLWNGTTWSNADTAATVGAQIHWTDLEASPTRPEYALGTVGTDNDMNVQIYDADADSWADVNELVANIPDTLQRGFDISYETTSGDLMAVSCNGNDAVYSIWNGTTWTATSSLVLANTNTCLYIELASDPTSDEIVAVFKHTNTGTPDYEIMVWSGSAWGNALALGDMAENANAGAAVVYEESGNQAIVTLSNNAATTLLYALWSGSAWSTTTHALGDHIEWASLRRDEGTDKVALCYMDNDTNIGVVQWTGSAWGTFTEIEQIGNSKAGQAIDCAFETSGVRDSYLMTSYSDATAGRYQFYATSSFNGELSVVAIQDSWRVLAVRGGDGVIHSMFFDDTNDRYDTSRWNGTTWTTLETISTSPSITGTPFDGSLSMAARTYPNFTSGSIRSTAIDFNEGAGPRWEEINFNETTPGSSSIEYHLYYLASTSAYALVPDSALPGNSAGFTTSPVDISSLDRTIYETLQLEAQFICVSGNCPVLNDWTLEWSEGITVSGNAYEYNASTTLTSGTVAVAVNGVTQAGKTATILGDGTWSISNVTAFEDDLVTVFIEAAADSDEAVGMTIYDGVGDVTGMELARRNVTLGSVDTPVLTNANIGHFDNTDDEDVFFTVNGSNVLTLCVESGCAVSKLRILAGTTYQPNANSVVVNFENEGIYSPATSTMRVTSEWTQNGTFNTSASTIIFTATTSSLTLSTATTTLTFYNLTFGETSGAATWSLNKNLVVNGSLGINFGTLARATSTMNIAQNLQIGASGYLSGLATTTFDGSSSYTWSDAKAATSSSNVGYVVVDGTAKTITLAGNVGAHSVTIGADDTLNASGSGYNINVNSSWVNNNAFIPQSGTVTFVGTTTGSISRGTSSFNNLSFTGVGGNWSFATSTLALSGSLSIATGTVTLPTGTTTIAGSFSNTGGTFLHNNGEVRMTSTSGGRTITQSGTAFLNAFYDLVFTGSGSWSFSEANATTTHHFRVMAGTVTLASSTLTVGGDFLLTGSGAFTHNNGEVILLITDNNLLHTNGSSFNNARTIGDIGVPFTRTFTDTNATILGNFIIDTGDTVVFPTGILSVGGSFDNNAAFTHSSGTVRFNSTAGAETIDAGNSSFATLEFNSATGDFTVTQNATATVAVNLTSAQQFTLTSGRTLATQGTFANAVTGANTTWTGSTLRLLSGTTVNLNLKTHGGDVYGTLEAASSTLAKMWNSSANTYVTSGTTGAIYSQDHSAIDGDLYVFGNYTRTSGTEYWSYATDFDGVALIASTSRQVDVRVSTSSQIGLTGASLNLVGSASASTTIDAQTGAFSLNATNTTVTAEHFRMTGTGVNGFGLKASSTLTTFRDGYFTVSPSHSAITIDASTIDTNAAAQFYRVSFATSSPGTASNVTLSGAPSSFVWFREGSGGLYGEAFDNADANPGSIRFDDSSNSIIVSGTVYADDGITALGGPTCDGVTLNVRIVVNSGSYASSTSCSGIDGSYTFSGVNYVGDPKVVIYLDTNGGVQGSVVTKTPTGNITNMHIYANRVITRHQDALPLTVSDMQLYDFDNDSDLRFVAATTSLTVLPNTELYVFASTTFAPGGNITLTGNGNSNSYEGTLQIGTGATFTATGTETHTLAGRFVMATTSTFTTASSTFVFNATTTGKSITAPSTVTFNQLQFSGLGGGWNITAPLSVLADMHVATGTVTGTSNITLTSGSLYGNGVLSLGSGTTTINRTNTLGGTSAWTFNNLVLGNGTVAGTTTPNTSATTTILGRLTIANAHFLDANSTIWDLAGTGTVFTETGTLLEDTSTIRFSGAGANVPSTNYYNLLLETGAGSATYTGIGSGILILNNLTVGGAATSIFNANTNDPLFEVRGSVLINSNGTIEASNSATSTVLGNWTNLGAFNGNSGTVAFTTTGASTIVAGASSFSNVVINGTGNFTFSENATTTSALTLANHANFTVNSGRTLAVGGQFTNSLGGGATTWTGSTLLLYGANTYSINASSTSDTYETLTIGAGNQTRMWNSSAATYNVNSTGSLYSQDHASVNGDAYVWGQLIRSNGNDYWSYLTDFDGTNISASPRIANIYFASGASATWNGASLYVIGSSSATTTLQNQGSGNYAIVISTGATTDWSRVQIRDIGTNGVVFTGTPTVNDFSYTDHLVEINSGSAMTVAGTVIDANQAKNFTSNIFAESGGVTSPKNVTATGTTVSSWRFTNHTGNISGESFDNDPDGDPGYIVWDDSAALVSISGTVYSDEGSTLSTICDGATNNIRLVVAGLTTYDTTCSVASSTFSIAGVAFSPLDTLTLYINGETEKAANVSVAPISSIGNMHLYENRVIVRHENTDPLTIANMAVWDSSDDADIPFTAVNAGTDTLTLPANTKLLIWSGKTFEPNGNVTLSGGGAGAAYDGTLEAQTNARFRAKTSEAHSVGGSIIFGTGAEFVSASSTLTLTTTGSSRIFDVNSNSLHNLTVSGSGSYVSSDTTMTLGGTYAQSAGTFTFGSATTSIGEAFNLTGGTFVSNGSPFLFNGTGAGNTVRFNGSSVAALTFSGSGSWNMTDTNATSTGSILITAGGVTLPSGNLTVGGSFVKSAGTVTHNTSDIIMTATSTALFTASSSDMFAVRFVGPAVFTVTDPSITFLDSFTIASGTVTMATGTTAVGGSFSVTGGSFYHSSGTVLMNASASGKTIDPSTSPFYNLQIGAPAGGYTMYSATTTNNFTIASVNILTVNPGSTISVNGVFNNAVGGVATTWTNSTLLLNGQNAYNVNTRSNSGDVYGTLSIGANSDIRMWYSSAATTTVNTASSLYSQDNANLNGNLYVYGDLTFATTTEYWSYATDFDGTSLSGSERQVTVRFAPNATTTVTTGSLQIVGASGFETNILNQGTSTYSLIVAGGTINANYYEFANLNIFGLQLLGMSTITNLANGYFDLAIATGTLMSLSSTTLNANPSKTFDNVGFTATTGLSGVNVNLTGETGNAWRFTNHYGTIDGEAFDIDGIDACGSIRFDDSACLLMEQTHARWRNDDGEEGSPNSEWYDSGFSNRTRVRILNNDNQTYSSTSVKIAVPYDAAMQSDFDDLRFTIDDGQTAVPFWVERYTASTDAQVWVIIPTMASSTYATVFMYYGSSTATSLSNGSTTFSAFDDYEDNSISEYSGDTSLFTTVTSPVFGGTYSLAPTSVTGKTTDGIFRFDDPVAQGQIIRYMQYVNTAGVTDEPCTLFGVQSPGTTNQNYAVCLELFGTDRISLAKDVDNNDTSGTVLATTTVSYSTGWYEVEIDWQIDDSIDVALYNSAGTLVATTSATDSSYTTGGYGYAFWYQNGVWDSFTSRPRISTAPTVYLGVKQAKDGATWMSVLDGVGSAIPNDTVRLRLSIENSGLDVTGELYRLEYAAKGAAPTCESIGGGSFVQVPNQASCGSSPICMQTSSYISNGDPTTDLLFETIGTFNSGQIVTSPSYETTALDIDQDFYTELEYTLTPTINASDAYCFRVTNAGTELDFYAKVPELGLQFDPTFGAVTLNAGAAINLIPGTTTAVSVTGTVTDFNGSGDLTYATTTIYRSGAGAACTPDSNNCYVATTENGQCTFTSCAGDSCTLSCEVDIYFHADPTDSGSIYDGQEWSAYAEAEDFTGGYDFASAPAVELITLRALDVDSAINYGSLTPDSDTGSFNPTTTVTNLGNTPLSVDIEGTSLTDGAASSIATDQQKVATSTFTYNSCVSCQQLATSSAVTLNLNLSKPNVPTPPVDTDVYWGIAVPFSVSNAPHTGTNIFTAIGPL